VFNVLGVLRRLSANRLLRWGVCILVGGGASLLLGGCSALTGGQGQENEPYEFSFRLRAGPPREATPRPARTLVCKPDGSCSELSPAVTGRS